MENYVESNSYRTFADEMIIYVLSNEETYLNYM